MARPKKEVSEKTRSNRIMITISDELLVKLDRLSDKIGVPRASLAVLLIADGVRSREQAEYFMSQLPEQIKSAISNPEVVKELTKSTQ